jgi:NAD-dependent SIR2 family protein deacetylase
VARLLRQAKHAIVFTGAGLSTGAGIPDFRSGLNTKLPTGPGLWAAQAEYERKHPVRNEQTRNDPARPKVDLDKFLHVQPTAAHRAIAKLVREGLVKTVLTQNVDNLHRRSGVPRANLAELHGNLQCERCEACGTEYERDYRIGPNGQQQHYTGRQCDKCAGWLKDYLVPFGEDLPESETSKAWTESDLADFCLVLGSSMTVTPACDYAGWVAQRWDKPKGKLVIVNIQKTPYDRDAAVVIHGFCDEVMEKVMHELGLDLD